MDSIIHFHQRLLAEAVRQLESLRGQPFDEPQAQAAGQAVDGSLEQRLIARAEALHCAPALQTALQQLRQMLGLSTLVLLVLAVLAGVGAAQLAFGVESEHPLNVYGLLMVLLALPTLTLLLWLGLLLIPKAMGGSVLGKIAFASGGWLSHKLHPGDDLLAAASRARSRLLLQGGGYWLFSGLSHALWLAYLLGVVLTTLVMLSIRQYGFVWETTILSAENYIALTRLLSALPAGLGFATPDAAQIMASRWYNGLTTISDAGAWSGFIVGCLIVYGVLPRALFTLLSVLLYRRACHRVRLDMDLPGYARLQTRLQPLSQSLGVVDPDTEPPTVITTALNAQPLIVALEAQRPAEWPPALGHDWVDLGKIEDRRSRSRVTEQLSELAATTDTLAGTLVVVCSLTMTPDRGLQRIIAQLVTTSPYSVLLLLSDGQRLRQRDTHADVIQRILDWRQLGIQAGVPDTDILELDLNHLTDASRSKLAARLGLSYQPLTAGGSHIAEACEVIVKQVAQWSQPPDATAQAELQRAIARCYGHRREGFKLALPTLDLTHASPKAALQHSADWVHRVLPPRLRANPRWMAVGAMSGALGCIALATLTSGAALAALPLWSGLGATLGLVIPPQTPDNAATEQAVNFADPVAAAALFMLLLELQGYSEAEISTALDQLLDTDMPTIRHASEAQQWLDQLRDRYNRWQEQSAS